MRCGGLTCRSTAVAAVASGGATMAPERDGRGPRHRRHERMDTTATATVVTATPRTTRIDERYPVVLQISRRRVEGRIQEDGRDKQRQGEIGLDGEAGAPGTNASSAPPRARNAGYGAPTLRARAARTRRRAAGRAALRIRSRHGTIFNFEVDSLFTDCLKIRDPSTPM